uniref:CpsB/CapC family capsule biosynthesis tyrosine phosphatase n=1 Tax=Eubacterium cellulosolvens TaxID=29322 RepID=UPI0012DD2768|nr:CpsB/CapC family capsule biosynthesis tyrosine phosphatase [[Eubacterium] cellulosolvens]
MSKICDIHSHLLPGLDDGSKDWETTLHMIKTEYEAGVRMIFATSHYLPWRHTIIAERIPSLCKEAEERAKSDLGIEMKIVPGQELYYHMELPEAIAGGKALTLAGSSHILVEFDERIPWQEMQQALQNLQRAGYRVIIAHCERFGCIRDPDHLEAVLAMGVRLQSNVQEMSNGFFDKTRKWLVKRYQEMQISYLGSDMHNLTKRPPITETQLKWFGKSLSEDYRQKLYWRNAEQILEEGTYGR